MAAEVTPLQPLRLPSGPSPITAEQRYWRSFKSQQLIPSPQSSPVTHISHPASSLHNAPTDLFAVTSGNRVRLFSTRTRKQIHSINRFGLNDQAHSGQLRPSDSAAVVAGGDSGAVQVFRTDSRGIIKTWTEHKQPVWFTRWSPTNSVQLLSGSDDRRIKLWDLSENESTATFTGHQDYVRSGEFLQGHSGNLFATGSYDQTVRIWDARSEDTTRSAMTFAHTAPIEAVLPLPSPSNPSAACTTIVSASGSQLAVLDLVAARPLEVLKNHHQKTITALSLASNNTRLLTGSLDGHVKIFDTASWRVVAGTKYPAPILSLSVIPGPVPTSSNPSSSSTSQDPQREDRHLAVGLTTGLLTLKTRLSPLQKSAQRNREAELTALASGQIETYDKARARKARLASANTPSGIRNKRLRGLEYEGQGASIIVEGRERQKRKKLAVWEDALRHGKYSGALDVALELSPPNPNSVLTLFTALQHRSALRAALKDRTASTLEPVLRWLVRHIVDPRHVSLLVRVGMQVLEMYGGELGRSARVDGLVERLHERVREGVEGAQVAEATCGMVGFVVGEVGGGCGSGG